MSGSDENMLLFIQTLGERIGPKSGTDRLLVIDGEPQSIVSESGPYFNYFIVRLMILQEIILDVTIWIAV